MPGLNPCHTPRTISSRSRTTVAGTRNEVGLEKGSATVRTHCLFLAIAGREDAHVGEACTPNRDAALSSLPNPSRPGDYFPPLPSRHGLRRFSPVFLLLSAYVLNRWDQYTYWFSSSLRNSGSTQASSPGSNAIDSTCDGNSISQNCEKLSATLNRFRRVGFFPSLGSNS